MREFSTPLTIELPATGNLTDDVVRNAREAADTVVFSRPGRDGLEDVTSADFLREVSAVAKGLVAAGIKAGDRVALISKTRYEWTLLDYAIWFARKSYEHMAQQPALADAEIAPGPRATMRW